MYIYEYIYTNTTYTRIYIADLLSVLRRMSTLLLRRPKFPSELHVRHYCYIYSNIPGVATKKSLNKFSAKEIQLDDTMQAETC